MAKLPWYMKGKGLTIKFHWLWVLWQVLKIKLKILIKKNYHRKKRNEMTTPEQIIAKIEEIEKLSSPELFNKWEDRADFTRYLLYLKQTAIRVFNLPTADPPEGSPGQEDMKG